MNIVIPFRNTCGTKELDMCIALAMKNLDFKWEKIYVVGDSYSPSNKKRIVNVIVEEQKYSKWLDSNFLVKYYIENISDEPFILFNDDFFITTSVSKIGQYFSSTIQDRINKTYVIEGRTNQLRLSMYGLNLKSFLKHYGDWMNFEVHTPMLIEHPKIMVQAIEESNINECPACKRTLYMYMLDKLGHTKNEDIYSLPYDCKFKEPYTILQTPFFSLTDEEYKAFEEIFIDILNH